MNKVSKVWFTVLGLVCFAVSLLVFGALLLGCAGAERLPVDSDERQAADPTTDGPVESPVRSPRVAVVVPATSASSGPKGEPSCLSCAEALGATAPLYCPDAIPAADTLIACIADNCSGLCDQAEYLLDDAPRCMECAVDACADALNACGAS